MTVSELADGEWVPLTSRLDEAGHLVGTLVGMNLTQFTQVAMLPQGRFQAFLRARSEDRQRLLQQLFRTGRFAQVELWLREHRVAPAQGRRDRPPVDRRRGQPDQRGRRGSLSPTTGTCTTSPCPPARARCPRGSSSCATTPGAPATRPPSYSGGRWARRRRCAAGWSGARVVHEKRGRYQEARAERAALLTLSDQHRSSLRRLDDARRAAGIAPLRRVADDAAARLVAAERHAETTFAALGVTPRRAPRARGRPHRRRCPGPRAASPGRRGWTSWPPRSPGSRPRGSMSSPSGPRSQARQREAPATIARLRAECDDAAAARAAREGVELRWAAADERVRAQQEALEVAASLESGRVALAARARGRARPARAMADDP